MIASNEAWNSELRLNVLDQIIQLFDYISIYIYIYISLSKFVIQVIIIASTTVCLQEKLSGVHNFAPFNLTVWIKDQNSTLGIELDTINTLFSSPTSVLLFKPLIRFLAVYFESI